MKEHIITIMIICFTSGLFSKATTYDPFSKNIGPERSRYGTLPQVPDAGTIIDGQWQGKKISFHAITIRDVPQAQAMISDNGKVVKEIKIEKCVPGAMTTQKYVKGQAKFVYKDNEGRNYTCFYKTN